MGWGLAAMAAMNYLSSQQQSKAAKESSQPLPTYYKEYQSPQQQEMYGYMNPMMQNMFSGNMPTMQGPTAGWYSGLDENVRAGIEEPYMRGMDMMRDQLGGTGMLGNQRAGMSGAAADVYGQYMQKAAPTMAQTGWNMMQPSMTANFNAQMFPYQTLPSMMPQTYSDLLVGHHPHIGPAGTPYQDPNQGTSGTHTDVYGHEVPDSYKGTYGYDPYGK